MPPNPPNKHVASPRAAWSEAPCKYPHFSRTILNPPRNEILDTPLGVNIDVELNFNHHIALLCNKAGRQINALSRLSNILNVDNKILILQSSILSHFMYCCIIWHFCSISDTKKIEKMQLKAIRHIYKDYTSSYEMLREKCNRPMLLIERQRAMLLEVYKCIHELGPRYRHGMFSQKSRAYDYRDPSILTLSIYNTITQWQKMFYV